MNRARMLMVGATWTYGAQIATVVLQLAYAAVTSRIIDADGFGAYAVALSVAGLVSLLANGGLSQTIGRMRELTIERLRGLFTYAILLGALAGLFLLLTSNFWAWLWGVPDSSVPIRWLSISALGAPIFAYLVGYLRRIGNFRGLAFITLFSNFVGMLFGAIGVWFFRSASSLLISPILSQTAIILVCVFLVGFKYLKPGKLRYAKTDVNFSWKITGVNLFSHFNANVLRWSTARFLGSSYLGAWNRADVVTTVPFQQLQTALLQVLYPEFRNQIGNPSKARAIWSDLLTLMAWLFIPLATLLAALGPDLVVFIFGQGWSEVNNLIPVLSFVAGIGILSTVLSSAINSGGWFRIIYFGHLLTMLIHLFAVVLLIHSREILLAMFAIIISYGLKHIIQIFYLVRKKYLDLKKLALNYLSVGIFSFSLYIFLMQIKFLIKGENNTILLLFSFLSLVFYAFLSKKLFPYTTIKKYRFW